MAGKGWSQKSKCTFVSDDQKCFEPDWWRTVKESSHHRVKFDEARRSVMFQMFTATVGGVAMALGAAWCFGWAASLFAGHFVSADDAHWIGGLVSVGIICGQSKSAYVLTQAVRQISRPAAAKPLDNDL